MPLYKREGLIKTAIVTRDPDDAARTTSEEWRSR
jgi:hypothetical protein